MIGLGYGSLFTLIYMTIFNFSTHSEDVFKLWITTLAFMFIGVYFSFSGLILRQEHWSMLKRTLVHFLLSVTVFYVITLGMGVQPFEVWPILVSLFIFVLIYLGFWLGFIMYYKKIFRDMNNSIK